ncbi:MAG: GNAT family N-acetyltransferase [Leptolinea sp.]|jgi:ribosomal protein S18 acetylase RimI-like enzyme|nr:GNAT family N-acetyltransferase [Leptolinea sp.]
MDKADIVGDIHIRNYRHPDDYQAVYAVWESAGKGIHIAASDSLEEIGKLVKKSPGLFFVAELEGRIIGTVMGGFDGRRGLIYHLAVHPEYQNKHIGSRLLLQVEEALYNIGCTKVYLFLVPENIQQAGFYRKLNYEQMDVVPFTKYLREQPSMDK